MRQADAVLRRDVVGIGALNVDYVVRGVPVEPADRGVERAVDEATVLALLAAAGPARRAAAPGGSAFNAVHALAYARPALRLGYVGVAGRSPVSGVSAAAVLDARGVDLRWVLRDERRLSGTCVSVVAGTDRTLFTHAGADALVAGHLAAHHDALAGYLAQARLVHVTSFLDDRTPPALLALLEAVRAAGTGTAVSVDPGHVWCTERTPAVERILALADFLLLNEAELAALTDRPPGPAAAVVLLRRMSAPDAVVLVKQPTGVWCHRRDGDRVVTTAHRHTPLRAAETADPTGAGDVFAAGLLAALTADRGDVDGGARLGMLLARHKLRHPGSLGHGDFATLAADFDARRCR